MLAARHDDDDDELKYTIFSLTIFKNNTVEYAKTNKCFNQIF